MNSTNLWIIADIFSYAMKLKEDSTHFSKPTDFTRNRIFTFMTLFCIITNIPRKSMSVELDSQLKWVNDYLGLESEGSKSGFFKARKKIKASLFEKVHTHLVSNVYGAKNNDNLKRWNGYLLRGIDGSIFNVVDTPSNREYFGEGGNDQKTVCQARCMLSYDPLNKIIDQAHLGNLSVSERSVAREWLVDRNRDELCIYDRGFPGLSFQYQHDIHKVAYLMRIKLGHNKAVKDFVKSGCIDRVEEWELSSSVRKQLAEDYGIETASTDVLKVRLLGIELDNGELEVLVTNLLDQEAYPYELFKELYFLRWPTETTFCFLKNTLCIELSSGINSLSIMQEFWGTIIRANVQSLIEADAQEIITQKIKTRKHDYQVNRSRAAGILKPLWASLFLSSDPEKAYYQVVRKFSKEPEAIRKGRKVARKMKTYRRNRGKNVPLRNHKNVA